MNHYLQTLRAMLRLLESVGENHWAVWIREDIRLWEANSETSHHLSAYGGMGSFNDVWIRRSKQHGLTDLQEPWANTLFDWLKTLCYYLAQHPFERVTVASLLARVGSLDPALAAFEGGDKAPGSMRDLADAKRVLQGWRCLVCGHAEVSAQDVERAIARDLVPMMIFRACVAQSLIMQIEKILSLDVPGIEATRRQIIAAASVSEIKVANRDDWMRPCPGCGGEDTAVYRWISVPGPPLHLRPADDNLPMRKSFRQEGHS